MAYSHDYAVALLLTLLTAYVIAETNNTQQIIRVRSRAVASVWLFGMACMGTLHPYQPVLLATFCLSVSYFLLFRTYQQSQPMVDTFHVFFMLALGSTFYPRLLWLAPFMFWYLAIYMRALTFRSFFAALVGLVVPFWFWVPWQLWRADLTPIRTWYAGLTTIHAEGVGALLSPTPPVLAFYVLVFFTLWMTVYYLLHSYDDKIRTRMILYVYVCQSVLFVAYGVLIDVSAALPLLLLSVSPLVGHYFTLRNTWIGLCLFFLSLLAFLALIVLTSVDDAYAALIG